MAADSARSGCLACDLGDLNRAALEADLHQVHLNYHHMVDEAQALRKALEEIGGMGGPLYLLEPNQGERPDPVRAAQELRRIVTAALDQERADA